MSRELTRYPTSSVAVVLPKLGWLEGNKKTGDNLATERIGIKYLPTPGRWGQGQGGSLMKNNQVPFNKTQIEISLDPSSD